MSLPGVVRELSGVYHRLFDHSPAVHGEVRMFLLEFEDRRGDEFPGMLQTLMTLNEAKDVEVDKLISTDSMGRIVSKLDSLSHSVEKLIEMGQERLKIEPQVDNEEWRQFEVDFTRKQDEIEAEYQEQLERLKAEYKQKENEGMP